MNKKLKIYLGAVAVAIIGSGAVIVALYGQDEKAPPSDSPAAISSENQDIAESTANVPVPAVEPNETVPPVAVIPETPNGVIPSHPKAGPEIAVNKVESIKATKSSLPNEWHGPTLEDLEKLRSENALLEAQLKNAELKSKIATQGGSAFVSSSDGGQTNSSGPRVVMISGSENNYRASILMPSGAAIAAGVGTQIPGVGVVAGITPNEVIVGRGNTKRTLPLVNKSADGY